MSKWQTYYDKHRVRPVRSLVQAAVSLCTNKEAALDLGAGTLIESRFLLDAGFKRVIAVDSSPEILEFANGVNDDRLDVHVSSFQDFMLVPESYDLITAQFALPFHGPEGFDAFFGRLVSALRPGGVCTAQLFGDRDSWNIPGDTRAFHTKEEAQALLEKLEVKEFEEEEKEGMTASGEQKHWHVFHFIAVKE